MKRFASWGTRALGSAVVLGLTLWLLPTDEVWSSIRNVPLLLWVSGLALFLLAHVAAGAKWWLIAASAADVPFLAGLRAHFAGLAANLCLPGIAGGDVARAGLIFRWSKSRSSVAMGSVLDRLLDTGVLFLLSSAGALTLFRINDWLQSPLPKIALLAMLAGGGAALVILLLPRIPQTQRVSHLREVLSAYARRPGRILACLGLSLVVQSAFVLLSFQLARSTGLAIPLAAWFFAWPLAKLLAIVPVSLAGLGVREASLAALLAPLGGVPSTVVAASLIWQTILFAAGMLGAVAFLASRGSYRSTSMGSVTRAEGEV